MCRFASWVQSLAATMRARMNRWMHTCTHIYTYGSFLQVCVLMTCESCPTFSNWRIHIVRLHHVRRATDCFRGSHMRWVPTTHCEMQNNGKYQPNNSNCSLLAETSHPLFAERVPYSLISINVRPVVKSYFPSRIPASIAWICLNQHSCYSNGYQCQHQN